MGIVLIEDKAQKIEKHKIKNLWWKKHNIEVMRMPLPVGDYILANESVMDVIARKKMRCIEPKKMDFLGTYDICVDSKFSIQELISDLCGKGHARFRDELILAKNNGIKLVIVVENKGETIRKGVVNKTVRNIEDLHSWVNPRLWIFRNGKQLYPTATRGVTLMKICYTVQKRYGCFFVFCEPQESGKVILDVLQGAYNEWLY